jgi:hypothetical protein
MQKLQGHARFCLSLCAVVGLVISSQARAGSLSLLVTAADGNSILIQGAPVGTYTNGGNTLTVTSIATLNTFLLTNGTALQFNGLQASSDFAPTSGSAAGSFVTQSGSLYYNTSAPSADTGVVTVQAFQQGFLLPSGLTGTMQTSSTALFTSAPAGSTQSFASTYNGTLSSAAQTATSTGLAQNNDKFTANDNIPSFVTPFEISNTMTFSILPNAIQQATDGFVGSTTITAAVIPEPASLVLMAMGMPLFLMFAALYKRRRAAVA